MGGHNITPPPVPDPSNYKVEDSKYLMNVQRRLAEKGLKDPWLRNHVWRCHLNRGIKHPKWFLLDLFTYGWKIWVPLVGITIGVEHFLGIDYHVHDHSNNHKTDH